jgi:DNA-binding NtrC family response regulator
MTMSSSFATSPILVVDDMPDMRSILLRYLSFSLPGRPVLAAPSAEVALTIAGQPAPHVLITDYVLPGMSGMALASEAHMRWPGIYVVLMSVYNDTMLPFSKSGDLIHAFLQKPFKLEALDFLLAGGTAFEHDPIHQRCWPLARLADVAPLSVPRL